MDMSLYRAEIDETGSLIPLEHTALNEVTLTCVLHMDLVEVDFLPT